MAVDRGDLLQEVSLAVDRTVGDALDAEAKSGLISGLLDALYESKVHEDLTLGQLWERHDTYKSRLDALAKMRAPGSVVVLGQPEWEAAVRKVLGVGGAFSATQVLEAREVIIAEIGPSLRVSSGWTAGSALDAANLCEEENSALRRNLAWLAAQSEVSLETRRELSRRIRTWGGPLAVPENSIEDEAADHLRFQELAEQVADLAQEAIDARISEAPEGGEAAAGSDDGYTRGRVRHGWSQRLDGLLNQLRAYTVRGIPTTLAEVRALTERETRRNHAES
jgi:hypothetical protein